jgi:putative ABC transport system permease protein
VQSQSFADVNMGIGVLINALAALMIGEAIVGRRTMFFQLLAPFLGSITTISSFHFVWRLVSRRAIKIATGLFVLVMLGAPVLGLRRNPSPMVKEQIRE